MTETVEWDGCLTKIRIEGRNVLFEVVTGVVVAGAGGRMLHGDIVLRGPSVTLRRAPCEKKWREIWKKASVLRITIEGQEMIDEVKWARRRNRKRASAQGRRQKARNIPQGNRRIDIVRGPRFQRRGKKGRRRNHTGKDSRTRVWGGTARVGDVPMSRGTTIGIISS
jgi:hypothetical protein